MKNRLEQISQIVVTARQMRDIEDRIFANGMPVVALMEKVAGLIAHRIQSLFPLGKQIDNKSSRIGILVVLVIMVVML